MRFGGYANLLATAVFFGVSTVQAIAAGPVTPPVAQQVHTVDFTPLLDNGGPVVEIDFGNGVKGHFLIDTGSSRCLMSDAMVKRLGLSIRRDIFVSPDLRFSFTNTVRVPLLTVGDMDVAGIEFDVMGHQHFDQRGEDESFDGVLGVDLMAKCALFIDSPGKKLALIVPGNLSANDLAQVGMTAARRMELLPVKETALTAGGTRSVIGHYAVHTTLKAGNRVEKEDLLLDTGSSLTIVSADTIRKLMLPPSTRHEKAATVDLGAEPLGTARLDAFSVGDLALPGRQVRFSEHIEKGEIRPGGDFPTLLGEDVLASCRVLLDFPGRSAYFQPALPPLVLEDHAPTAAPVNWNRLRAAIQMPKLTIAAAASHWAGDLDDDYETQLSAAVRTAATISPTERAATYRVISLQYRLLGDEFRADAANLDAVLAAKAQLAAHPTDPSARIELALAMSDTGGESAAQALEMARKLVAEDEKNAAAWDCLGWILEGRAVSALKGDSHPLAVPHLPSLTDFAPYYALVAELLARRPSKEQVKEANQAKDEARLCFDRAVAIAPENADTYVARSAFRLHSGACVDAVVLRWRGKDINVSELVYDQAFLDDRRQAEKWDPKNVETLRYNAYLKAEWPRLHPVAVSAKGQKDAPSYAAQVSAARGEAAAEMNRLFTLTKDADAARASAASEALGQLYTRIFDSPEPSEECLRLSLVRDSHREVAAHALARLLQRQHRWDDLIALLRDRVATGEGTVQVRLLLVDTLARQGRLAEAETESVAAVATYPDDVTAHLGQSALRLRRLMGNGGPLLATITPTSLTATLADADAALSATNKALDAAETRLGSAPPDDARAALDSVRLAVRRERTEYANLRAIYLALSGATGDARRLLIQTLDDTPTDTAGREILESL